MNITQMRYFITIAQLENVTKASQLLHVSQSSLSKNILAVERELGVELFSRNGKNIQLNPAGERFLESCKRIISELDQAELELSDGLGVKNNTIRIGVEGGSGRIFGCMAAFKKLHSEVAYDVSCSIEMQVHPDINDYDVLVYPYDKKYEKFKGYDLYKDRYFLAINSESELSNKTSVTLNDLNGRDMVFLKYSDDSCEFPLEICRALTVNMKSVSFTDSRLIHRQMISSGIAAGFIPESSIEMYKNDDNIRNLIIMNKKFTRQMMICFKREKHLTDVALAFRRFAVEYFKIEE